MILSFKLNNNDKAVLQKLTELENQSSIKSLGINTRSIANASNLDIYKTRYSLLKLNKLGYVRIVSKNTEKTIRWDAVQTPLNKNE